MLSNKLGLVSQNNCIFFVGSLLIMVVSLSSSLVSKFATASLVSSMAGVIDAEAYHDVASSDTTFQLIHIAKWWIKTLIALLLKR